MGRMTSYKEEENDRHMFVRRYKPNGYNLPGVPFIEYLMDILDYK